MYVCCAVRVHQSPVVPSIPNSVQPKACIGFTLKCST
ncbi:hypothetical protein T12_14950 [Trichinella patagoniensis]|uniref:Uncharacterized protein n=1 Tax=Trichinella patagoniensis TaxID=990121 RepID=A0A0V0WLI7_9BILA|nr:hypothetical protein T12_14950 [Trichinella patagoniensis]